MNATTATDTESTTATYFTMETDEGGITTLVFDSPDGRVNTFTRAAIEELAEHVTELERRAAEGSTRGVMFASGKEGNFIAGADIHLIREISTPQEGREAAAAGQAIFARIQDLPVPATPGLI